MTLGNASARVLANKGVPVQVHVLKREDGELMWPPRPLTRADETYAMEERFVRLGNIQIADLEVLYDGLDNWQLALQRKPFDTIIATLAVCWADDEVLGRLPHDSEDPTKSMRRRALGAMLLDAKIDDYATAVGGAFMLANGVEPDAVGKALKQGAAAIKKSQDRLMSRLRVEQELTEVEIGSTTETPSEPGSEPAEHSTSSGD